jgi:hypothetical protein
LTAAAARSSLEATLVVAPPLALLFWLSGAVSFPVALAAMALVVYIVVSAGFVLLRLANAADMPASAVWVLGLFATAIVVYALAVAFGLLAASAFAIWAVMILALGFFLRAPAAARRIQLPEWLGLALCAATTVMWCREVAEVPAVLARSGEFPAWVDHFIHGGVISHFGDPRAAGSGSIEMAGFSVLPYHYATYLLPAAFAGPLDLPGLPLSTSVWLPMGFFTMCAGAYSLGTALAGPTGGIAALATLTLLPDASNYWLRNGFFSFHWNVIATPGALYGIGICLAAIAFMHRWHSAGCTRALVVALCLAAGLAVVRVHLFALGFPALLAAAAASTPTVRRRRLTFLGIAVLAFALFVFCFYALTDSVPALELFVADAHMAHEPNAYQGWYENLLESRGRGVAVPVGMLAVFVAGLGAFIVAYPVALTLTLRRRPLGAADRAPIAMLACYILLMLTAPVSQHGDATELTQRPFVLLYAVVGVWTAVTLVDWVVLRMRLDAKRAWVALLAASALGLPFLWAQIGMLSQPKFAWGWQHVTHKVARGLPQVAEFLRRNLRPGDVFAVQGLTLGWVASDVATELASLTGAPAYLARPWIQMSQGGRREQATLERYGALARVADAQSVAAARARLRELGIQWYVVADRGGPRWDPQRLRAALVAGDLAVYSSGSTSQ